MSKHFRVQRRFAFFALLTGIPAFLLMILGSFGPGWIGRQGRDSYTILEGIWFSQACPEFNGSCVMSTRGWILENFGLPGAFSALEEVHWQEFRVLTLCGLEGALNTVLVAAIVLAKRGKSSSVCILSIGFVSSLASFVFVMIPVLRSFTVSDKSQWCTDWSRLLAFIGCILEFVCSVLYILAMVQDCLRLIVHKDDGDDDSNSVDFELDSYDREEVMRNPGLELPSYDEISTGTPPPSYTELPDDPSLSFHN